MKYCTIKIRNIGPFREESSFDIKPLTIFIGRNSSGKSSLIRLLAYLNYTNDEKIEEEFKINIKRYFLEKLPREIKFIEKNDVSTLFNIFVSECFPYAYERRLIVIMKKESEKSFASLFRRGSELYIYSSSGKSIFSIVFEDRNVHVITYPALEDLATVLSAHNSSMSYTYLDDMIRFFLRLLRKIFYIPSLETSLIPHYFPDCRIMRVVSEDQLYMLDILSRTYYMNLEKILRNILNYVHIIEIILKAEESHILNEDIVYFSKIVRELLRELGIIDLSSVAIRFGEVQSPLLVMWDGTELSLEDLPSGIRQVISIVISFILLIVDMLPILESKGDCNSEFLILGPVFIEEPEIHMHPSALTLFARFIVYIVNLLKRFGLSVIISTHSDYFLYQISNLIALYNAWKKAGNEFLEKYGYHRLELLDPNDVAIYLIQRDDEKKTSRIVPIEVTEEGIVEDEFYKITEEMQREHLRAIKYIHMDKE